jgi:hypothetical protein
MEEGMEGRRRERWGREGVGEETLECVIINVGIQFLIPFVDLPNTCASHRPLEAAEFHWFGWIWLRL